MYVTDPKGSLAVTTHFTIIYCKVVQYSVKNDSLVNGTIELVFDDTGSCIYEYRVLLFEFFIQNKLGGHYGYLRVLRYKTYRYRKELP